MAMTLIEAAKNMTGEVLRATIIELFATQTDLLAALPFDDIPGNSLKYKQEDTLPGIAFRGIGEGYSESTGVINPQTESLVIVGGDMDVDKFIVKTMGSDQRSTQEAMKLKSLAHNFSNTFIKGDSITTPKQFDGLQLRLTGAQVISNNAAADGGALSLTKLDEAIDAVDGANALFMTKKVKRRLSQAARTSTVGGYITFELSQFGTKVMMYNGLPILIADANWDLFATLGDNEAYSGGGTADGTSIYAMRIAPGYLQGIQNGPPEVTDLGELEGKPTLRTRIEWYAGMVLMHPRAASRLRDVDAALAAVA